AIAERWGLHRAEDLDAHARSFRQLRGRFEDDRPVLHSTFQRHDQIPRMWCCGIVTPICERGSVNCFAIATGPFSRAANDEAIDAPNPPSPLPLPPGKAGGRGSANCCARLSPTARGVGYALPPLRG